MLSKIEYTSEALVIDFPLICVKTSPGFNPALKHEKTIIVVRVYK